MKNRIIVQYAPPAEMAPDDAVLAVLEDGAEDEPTGEESAAATQDAVAGGLDEDGSSEPQAPLYMVTLAKPIKGPVWRFEPLYDPILACDAAEVAAAVQALKREHTAYSVPIENHTTLPL